VKIYPWKDKTASLAFCFKNDIPQYNSSVVVSIFYFLFSLMDLQLYRQRHSLAHLLAQAILRTIDSNADFGTGPAVDDGCYYDVKFADGITFSETQAKELTKTISSLLKENQTMTSYTTTSLVEAHDIATMMHQSFKHELLEKFASK
jgi:threonyl-tRNA synthetase